MSPKNTAMLQRKKIARLISLFFFCFSPHISSAQSSPNSTDSALSEADVFAIGMIGFIGHISRGESAYQEILASSNAESRFWSIYQSAASSREAKLYVACGLKALSSRNFEKVYAELSGSKELVTTMKGESLRQEKASEIIVRIKKFGCK